MGRRSDPSAPHTPVITTERLTLRAPKLDDFAAHREFYASELSASLGGPVPTGEAWRRFSSLAGHWALMGFGWFTVEDSEGPRGIVGVHQPPHYEAMEIGWALFGGATGRGYAVEAATATRDWAFAALAPQRLVSFIDPDNTASQAVARRLGAVNSGRRAKHNPDCDVWEHPRA